MTANNITVNNTNLTGDIVLDTGANLNATATSGTSILLASKRNFVNNAGASVMNIAGSSRWLSYSTNPSNDVIGSLSADFTLYNCVYGGSCGALGSGNGFLYSFNNSPLTPTPNNSGRPVPPTVLYVSQTPPINIIYNTPSNVKPDSDEGDTQMANVDTFDYLSTSPQDTADDKTYSLFNGWIIIDPTLVKKLNLIWSQI